MDSLFKKTRIEHWGKFLLLQNSEQKNIFRTMENCYFYMISYFFHTTETLSSLMLLWWLIYVHQMNIVSEMSGECHLTFTTLLSLKKNILVILVRNKNQLLNVPLFGEEGQGTSSMFFLVTLMLMIVTGH